MKLPPALLERLKTSNMMGLGEKEGLQYIKSDNGEFEPNPTQPEAKLLPDITAELKEYGAEPELADFCLELYHALRNYKEQDPSLVDLKTICEQGLQKDCKELVPLISRLETSLMKIKGYKLRVNQIQALVVLLFGTQKRFRGSLLELATGEGKSCVIACFAAIKALSGVKVDVICSSKILAERDKEEWLPFYRELGIGAASIPLKETNRTERETAKAYRDTYSHQIVYGTVHDFSADLLRAEFEGKETRGLRGFHNLIVDEVDHLTLDNCLSFTYLSHRARGVHHLNGVLAQVWQSVTNYLPVQPNQFMFMPQFFPTMLATLISSDGKGDPMTEVDVMEELVHKMGLLPENCYKETLTLQELKQGVSSKEPDENNNIDELTAATDAWQAVVKAALVDTYQTSLSETICQLIQAFKINSNIYVLDKKDVPVKLQPADEEDNKNSLLILPNGFVAVYLDQETVTKLIQDKVGERIESKDEAIRLPLPSSLVQYATNLLPRFIKNALSAAYEMKEGQAYTIVRDQISGTDNPMFDRIVPVDFASTGILEKNKKYSDGIQQFLEMKHQLSVSDFSLTTNFMSNYTFYNRFRKIHGLTGTLGNQWDKQFLKDTLQLQCLKIPSSRKELILPYPMLMAEEDAWTEEIIKEAIGKGSKGQAVLLICRDINTAQHIYKYVNQDVKGKVFLYCRDDAHSLPKDKLESGDIVISTALASRGTDIKVSDKVIKCGGLHVLLTYLPRDSRTERQIIGRTGRKGLPGSCRLIINRNQTQQQLQTENIDEEIKMRAMRDSIEGTRVDALNKSLTVILFQEKLFDIFCTSLKETDSQFSELERKNEGEFNYKLNDLMKDLQHRLIDFLAVKEGLKESWALWYSDHSPRIANNAKSVDDQNEIVQSLMNMIKVELESLCNGNSNNIYLHLSHALGRTVLYENNSSQSEMTPNFVLKSWKETEESASKQDLRYLSSVYYNLAYYTIVNKSNDYVNVAIENLSKAKESLNTRMEDNLIQMHSMKTFASKSTFDPHTRSKKGTNLMVQVDNRFVILESFSKNIAELIEKLKALKKEDVTVLAKSKDISMLFKDDRDPILTEELSMFIGDGHFQLFDVEKEPQKGFCWSGFWVTLLGVAQIIGGVLLCTFSSGLFSSLGMDLIIEGISDVIAGVQAMVTGVFSWAQWAISKAISLAISFISFGFSSFKWVKAGVSFTKTGAKLSLKQAAKYTAKTAVVQGGLHIGGEIFDYGSRKALENLYETKKKDLLSHIKNAKNLFSVIKQCLRQSITKEECQNENIIHSHAHDLQARTNGIVGKLLNDCMENSEWMNKFSSIMKQWTGPLTELVSKTILKDKGKWSSVLQTAVKTVNTGTGLAVAVKSYAELQTFIDTVIEDLEQKIRGDFKLASDHNTIDDDLMELDSKAREIQSGMAIMISGFVWEKSVDISSGLMNCTVKAWGNAKIAKHLDKLSNLDRERSYFEDKQNTHKQFHQDRLNNGNLTKDYDVSGIITEKEGKPGDALDVLALSNQTGKTILIETIDDKGNVIKIDKTPGNSSEVIHLQNVRSKNEDGSYSGHFQEVGKDGKIVKNLGTDNTCLYQAVLQAEGRTSQADLTQAAHNLRKNALSGMDPNILVKTYQRQQVYNDTHIGCLWSLAGGGRGGRQFKDIYSEEEEELKDKGRARSENLPMNENLEEHFEERVVEDFMKTWYLAKESNKDKRFDEIFEVAATHQAYKGDHTNRAQFDPNNSDHTHQGGSDKICNDAAHTFCLGLKLDAVQDKFLKRQISKVNLIPHNINSRGGMDTKIDQLQRDFMKEHYDNTMINTKGEIVFKNKDKDFVQTYLSFLEPKGSHFVDHFKNKHKMLNSTTNRANVYSSDIFKKITSSLKVDELKTRERINAATRTASTNYQYLRQPRPATESPTASPAAKPAVKPAAKPAAKTASSPAAKPDASPAATPPSAKDQSDSKRRKFQ